MNWQKKGKRIKSGLFILLLSVTQFFTVGCSSEDIQQAQQTNADGYIVTELTTAIDENNTVIENPDTQSVDMVSSNGSTQSSNWFDDAVFLGDSVTLKLSYYCDANTDALGNAQFFCAGSLGYTNALFPLDDENAVHPYYKGVIQKSEDCAVVTSANKVFVMLGMNDIGLYGTDGALESAVTLLGNIQSKSPNAVIYVQSVTPILPSHEGSSLNNTSVREFNEKLKNLSAEKGYHYLDIYSIMADENGALRENYCGDPDAMGIHFTNEACAIWCEYLKNNV